MSWLQAILLGLLQGLTEFLPVSSTAHMAIFPQLFGASDPGATFSAIAQMGPIIAIIIYFRKDIARYVSGILRTKTPANIRPGDLDAKIGWFVLLASLPGMVFGYVLEKKIDREFRSLYVIAASLIIFAIVLWIAERIGERRKSLEEITFKESQIIGWAQVLSLVPGASRSGVTISAGLFSGLNRESAARFSFLLSLPFITGAGIYKLYKALRPAHIAPGTTVPAASGLHAVAWPAVLAALVAGIFAYVVVRWFLGYMKEHSTTGFIVYRIALGVFLLGLLASHKLQANPPRPEDAPTVAPTTANMQWQMPQSRSMPIAIAARTPQP